MIAFILNVKLLYVYINFYPQFWFLVVKSKFSKIKTCLLSENYI